MQKSKCKRGASGSVAHNHYHVRCIPLDIVFEAIMRSEVALTNVGTSVLHWLGLVSALNPNVGG